MWNGLFFGLVNLFTPQASLPDIAGFQQHIQEFAQVYAINTQRIQVREGIMNNPSPFLTQGGIKTCTLHINHHAEAKQVWSHFLNGSEEGHDTALLAFTAAHELTHCLMAEAGKRPIARKALENHLGSQFRNNIHFEETLADLVGLAYVQHTMPAHFDWVQARIKNIRNDFSNRDADHDSTHALKPEALALVNSLFRASKTIRLAEGTAQEKFTAN